MQTGIGYLAVYYLSNFGKAIYSFERESQLDPAKNKVSVENRAGNAVI